MRRADVPMRLQFLGAAVTVTGSRYLVDAGDSRRLVDRTREIARRTADAVERALGA